MTIKISLDVRDGVFGVIFEIYSKFSSSLLITQTRNLININNNFSYEIVKNKRIAFQTIQDIYMIYMNAGFNLTANLK